MNGQQQQQAIQLRPVELDVISVATAEEMQNEVNKRLQKGYLFHGDMKVVYVPDTGASPITFVQAMVRVEPVAVPMPRQQRDSGIVIPQ